MWLNDVESAFISFDQIYENISARREPVVVLGAGLWAKKATELLKNHSIEITGYAVSEEYFSQAQSYLGKPVLLIDDFVCGGGTCVLGIGPQANEENHLKAFWLLRKLMEQKNVCLYVLPELFCTFGEFSIRFLRENYDLLDKFYRSLADERSRNVFLSYVKACASKNIRFILDVYQKDQYFNELTQSFSEGVFVDCGAYVGDTVVEFVNWSGGKYKRIYAIEADMYNRKKLFESVEHRDYHDVHIIPSAVGDYCGEIRFDSGNGGSSSIKDGGSDIITVDTIDHILGGYSVDLIKMDIEGNELAALKGAERTIRESGPALAICVYHKKEDLITIPQYIQSINKNFTFYLRHHSPVTVEELVLYAIPKK